MPYLQPNTNITLKQARDNQERISNMNKEKSCLNPDWVKQGFIGTCLEDIALKYQHTINRNNAVNFNTECVNKLKELYGDSYVKEIQKGLNFVFNTIWSEETFVWKLIYNVTDILRPIQQQEKLKQEYLELITQLQRYGLYQHFKIHSDQQIHPNSTEQLKKLLIECKQKSDPQQILNNETLMNELVSSRALCYLSKDKRNDKVTYIKYEHSYRTKLNSLSPIPSVISVIEKEVESRAMNRTIEVEANRRITEQKAQEEKQAFEDAVQKRMAELMRN